MLSLGAVSFPLVLHGFLSKLFQTVCDYCALSLGLGVERVSVTHFLLCTPLFTDLTRVRCEVFLPSQVKYLTRLNWTTPNSLSEELRGSKRGDVICWGWSGGYGEFYCTCENFDCYESLKINRWLVLPRVWQRFFCTGQTLLSTSLGCAQHRVVPAPCTGVVFLVLEAGVGWKAQRGKALPLRTTAVAVSSVICQGKNLFS